MNPKPRENENAGLSDTFSGEGYAGLCDSFSGEGDADLPDSFSREGDAGLHDNFSGGEGGGALFCPSVTKSPLSPSAFN